MNNDDPGKTHHADKELSQLYQSLQAPQAGAATDAAILDFAKQRTLISRRKSRINWTGGVSVAASILAVYVLYWTQFVPENVSSQEPADASEISSTLNSDPGAESLAKRGVRQAGKNIASKPQVETTKKTMTGATKAIVSAEEKMQVAALDLAAETQQPSGPEPMVSATSGTASKLEAAAMSQRKIETNVRPIPECRVYLHDGYKLSGTPLGAFTQHWTDDDKRWLVEQLKDYKPLKMAMASYSGKNLEYMQRAGFDVAYQQTLESIKNCKTSHGLADK